MDPNPIPPMEVVSLGKWARDAAERVIVTYVEAFIALLLASWTPAIDVSVWQVAAWAAIPAALAALKASLATLRGAPDSASLSRQVP